MFHRLRRRQRRKRKEAGNRRRLSLSLMVKKRARAGANSLAPYVKHLHSPAFSSSMIDSNVVNCQLPFISVSVPGSNDKSTFSCLSFSYDLDDSPFLGKKGKTTFVICVCRRLTLRSLSNKESPRCSALCKTWISQSRGHSPPFQCL